MVVCAQVWAHLVCLQVQMSQHPRHFHYNFGHYMCDLCQHELRVQAAQVGSRSGRASPRSTSSNPLRKPAPACARSGEVCTQPDTLVPSQLFNTVAYTPGTGGCPIPQRR